MRTEMWVTSGKALPSTKKKKARLMGLAILETLSNTLFKQRRLPMDVSVVHHSPISPAHQDVRTRGHKLSPGPWIGSQCVDQRIALEQSPATEHQAMRQSRNR